jgi:hypothetical protein
MSTADDALKARFEKLSAAEREQAAGQVWTAMLNIWSITIAALIGRGVLDADNLRRDLLGGAKVERECGAEFAALTMENVASNIDAMIKAVERVRENPPTPGSA